VVQLARMAQGEPPGYDVRSCLNVVVDALRSGKLSPNGPGQASAVAVLARIPRAKAQMELATVVADGRYPPPVRNFAGAAVVQAIQKHSALRSQQMVANLETLQGRPDTEPNLRGTLALVLGSLRPDSRTAGERLLRFRPDAPLPAPKEK